MRGELMIRIRFQKRQMIPNKQHEIEKEEKCRKKIDCELKYCFCGQQGELLDGFIDRFKLSQTNAAQTTVRYVRVGVCQYIYFLYYERNEIRSICT